VEGLHIVLYIKVHYRTLDSLLPSVVENKSQVRLAAKVVALFNVVTFKMFTPKIVFLVKKNALFA